MWQKLKGTSASLLTVDRQSHQANAVIMSTQLRKARIAQHSAEARAMSAEEHAARAEAKLDRYQQKEQEARTMNVKPPSVSKAEQQERAADTHLDLVERASAKMKAAKQKRALKELNQMSNSMQKLAASKPKKYLEKAADAHSVEEQAIKLAERASSSSNIQQFEKAAAMLSGSISMLQESSKASKDGTSAERTNSRESNKPDALGQLLKGQVAAADHKLQSFLKQLSTQSLAKWQPNAGVPATADDALLPETKHAFQRVEAHKAKQQAKAADQEIDNITSQATRSAARMAHHVRVTNDNTARISSTITTAHIQHSRKTSSLVQKLKEADARFNKLFHKAGDGKRTRLGEANIQGRGTETSSLVQKLREADARFNKLFHKKTREVTIRNLGEGSHKKAKSEHKKRAKTVTVTKAKKSLATRKNKSAHSTEFVGMRMMPVKDAISRWRKIERHPLSKKRQPAVSVHQQKLLEQQKKLDSLRKSTQSLGKLLDPAVQTSSKLASAAAAKARRLEAAAAIATIQAQNGRSKVPDAKQTSKQQSRRNSHNQMDLAIKPTN
jgi:uncharacterized protein YdcH (DUF465 family)